MDKNRNKITNVMNLRICGDFRNLLDDHKSAEEKTIDKLRSAEMRAKRPKELENGKRRERRREERKDNSAMRYGQMH